MMFFHFFMYGLKYCQTVFAFYLCPKRPPCEHRNLLSIRHTAPPLHDGVTPTWYNEFLALGTSPESFEFSRELPWVKPTDISVPNDIWRHILFPRISKIWPTQKDDKHCGVTPRATIFRRWSCHARQVNKRDLRCFRGGGGEDWRGRERVPDGVFCFRVASSRHVTNVDRSFRVFKTKKSMQRQPSSQP